MWRDGRITVNVHSTDLVGKRAECCTATWGRRMFVDVALERAQERFEVLDRSRVGAGRSPGGI